MSKSLAALLLLVRFARAVAVSGWQTFAVILKASVGERRSPTTWLGRVRFAPVRPRRSALPGCMVSLTAGTTKIHTGPARRADPPHRQGVSIIQNLSS